MNEFKHIHCLAANTCTIPELLLDLVTGALLDDNSSGTVGFVYNDVYTSVTISY